MTFISVELLIVKIKCRDISEHLSFFRALRLTTSDKTAGVYSKVTAGNSFGVKYIFPPDNYEYKSSRLSRHYTELMQVWQYFQPR